MFDVPFINLEYVYSQLYELIIGEHNRLWIFLKTAGLVIWIVSAVAVIFLFWAIVYVWRRLTVLRAELSTVNTEVSAGVAAGKELKNPRWEKVLAQLNSTNEADWKIAIIEADAMLDELVRNLYPHLGDNLGERLKGIEPSDFATLQDAWDAHKVRNQIAHDHNYRLSEREARIALGHYQAVFEEFHYI